MIGTLLNVAGILAGGAAGLIGKRGIPARRQAGIKVILGALTVFYGLRLVWMSAAGSVSHWIRVLGIMVLSLMLGNLIGRLLRLQQTSNRAGQMAKQVLAAPSTDPNRRRSDGFRVCVALFCIAPLGIIGAVTDGLSHYYYPLAIKAVMDGLATMEIVLVLGWSPLLSAIPVLALEGSITLVAQEGLSGWLTSRNLLEPTEATAGLLIFTVALVILQLKRVSLVNYLPALAVAPGLGLLWPK